MSVGYITTFIVGGMILLSILSMNFSITQSNTELAMGRTIKQHVSSITDVVAYDMVKIGYNWNNKIDDPIVAADSTKLVFFSNIDNDPANDVEKITWTFGNTGISTTENPDDHVVTRLVVQGSTTVSKTDIKLGVTTFTFRYYDQIGDTVPMPTPVLNPQDIKQIEVEVIVESGEKFYDSRSSDGRYIVSTWLKRFSPINLRD